MIFSHLYRFWKVLLPVGALLLFGGGYAFFSSPEASEPVEQEVYKTVQLVRADQLISTPVVSTTLGTVQSNHDVEIRAEASGKIVALNVKNGDVLEVGQVLMELDHQVTDAQVLQAEARLASALAQLSKLKNGERPEEVAILEQKLISAREKLKEMQRGSRPEEIAILQTQLKNANNTLKDAKIDFENTTSRTVRDLDAVLQGSVSQIQSAASTIEKVLSQNLQNIIYPIRYPLNKECELRLQTNYTQDIEFMCELLLGEMEEQKLLSQSLLQTEEPLTAEQMLADLHESRERIRKVQQFLSVTLDVVSSSIAIDRGQGSSSITETELIALKTPVTSSQSEINSLYSTLTSQIEGIKNQEVSNQSAIDSAQARVNQATNAVLSLEKELVFKSSSASPEQLAIQGSEIRQMELQLEIAQTGARVEDILGQEAQVKQAQADVAVAVANREKAIVRSPLRGTVLQIPFQVGDFVNGGERLATVADRENLQVKTYITEKEIELVLVGGLVSAQDGKVKGVVQEISPALEQETKKIEVIVRLTEGIEHLVLGQTVFVGFESQLSENTLRVPLSAVRVIGEDAFVFTVDDRNMVKALPVAVGTLLEDTVIVSGVNPDQLIIVDILGIKEGEKVHSSSSL